MADEAAATVAPDEQLLNSLMADTPKEEKPKEEEPKDEPTPEADKPEEEAKPKDEPEPKPREGTPDKALQKVQQDLAANTRLLEKLSAKLDSGEVLTNREQEQVKQAKGKLVGLKEKLSGGTFDSITDGQELAEAVVEDRADSESRLKALEDQLAAMRAATEKQADEAFYAKSSSQWPGLNHEEIWSKSVEDTFKELDVTQEDVEANAKLKKTVHKAVHKEYARRCENAAKSIEARKDKKEQDKKEPVKPKIEGGRFTAEKSGTISAPHDLTDEQRHFALIEGLLAKEK